MKKIPIRILLLAIFLFFLTVFLWMDWKIGVLEAEREMLYQQLYNGQIDASFDFSRTSEIYAALHGRYGLYWCRSRAAVSAGASCFVFFCVNLERLKKWLYREK